MATATIFRDADGGPMAQRIPIPREEVAVTGLGCLSFRCLHSRQQKANNTEPIRTSKHRFA
jgi:hypothetical protein